MATGEPSRIELKRYTPDAVGTKIGWTNLVHNEENEVFTLQGAFGRVGESGASLTVYEHEGRRLYSSDSVRGIARACHWQMTIVPHSDTHRSEWPRVAFGARSGYGDIRTGLVGEGFYDAPHVTSEMFVESDEAIADAIRTTLSGAGLEHEYPHTYLAINGWVGSHIQHDNQNVDRREIAREQLFDPTMVEVAAAEHTIAEQYARHLHSRATEAGVAKVAHSRGELTAGGYLRMREKEVVATLAGEKLVDALTVRKLIYTPEDFPMTRHLGAGEGGSIIDAYLSTMRTIENGNATHLGESLDLEHKKLQRRYNFAKRGAFSFLLLTENARNMMFPEGE